MIFIFHQTRNAEVHRFRVLAAPSRYWGCKEDYGLDLAPYVLVTRLLS